MNSVIKQESADRSSKSGNVQTNKKAKIIIMAGGTGGHVFPALAVAKELSQEGVHVVWLGTRAGIESKLVPNAGYPIHYLSIAGLVGTGLKRKLLAPFMLFSALMQSLFFLLKEKPQCVLGMGGFASGPGGVAAKILGKKIIIHEQNAFAGLTNQKLSFLADSILTGFRSCEGLPNTSVWVGNPVREEIFLKANAKANIKNDMSVNVLILGGSQGAKSLNDFLPESLAKVAENVDLRVWHQTGEGKSVQVNTCYQGLGPFNSVLVEEFINDIDVAYAWADLVICRAGAMTIAELMAAGKPSVLVPYPYAAGDHQTKNARFMVNAEAAILINDDKINTQKFTQQILNLLQSSEKRAFMSNNARDLYRPTAAKQVADFCKVYIYA